ncbi:hypothetical protein GBP346_A2009 [Burkholderia pseudomallei MSHR346]|nr:hypothetical protein GBP346_A2009 [Burkholderia pseudomallei MSHR346]KGS87376.1 hypothetical protein X947_2262 [Burkholderia pseudomallei MSHR7334]ONC70163.1 hypothetical protein AQ922_16775 [Burkholderia pseudomallei]
MPPWRAAAASVGSRGGRAAKQPLAAVRFPRRGDRRRGRCDRYRRRGHAASASVATNGAAHPA